MFGPGKCLAGSGEVVFLRAFLMRQGKGCVRAELKSVRDATCSARLTFFFFFFVKLPRHDLCFLNLL